MALYIVILTYSDYRVEDKRILKSLKASISPARNCDILPPFPNVWTLSHPDLRENQQHGQFTRPKCKLTADKRRYCEGKRNRGGKKTLLIVFLVVWQLPTFRTTHSTFARKVAQVKKKKRKVMKMKTENRQ
jgi:hypothetical protein